MNLCFVGTKVDLVDKGEKSSMALLINEAKKLGFTITNIPKSEIKYSLSNNKFEVFTDINLENVDIFFFRDVTGLVNRTTNDRVRIFSEVIEFAKQLKKHFSKARIFDRFLLSPNPELNKLKAYHMLAGADIPIIPSYLFMTKKSVFSALDRLIFPLILKPINGVRGEGIFLFKNRGELIYFLEHNLETEFFYPNLLQKYIENNGDYRVLVLDGKVIACVKKSKSEGGVVANMSKGNMASGIDPVPADIADIAIRAANSIGIEFAGVDIIEDINTGEKFVLEVNLSPQIFYTSFYSDKNIAEMLITYLKETTKL